jgi:NAD(P)-dependent dehydrogenase (short-subunit alcohol dehydrogenase family)
MTSAGPQLEGTVALVTGASRGVGKGVALALGRAGATVFVSGRTRRGEVGPGGLEGSVDDTADAVTEAGGRGVAVAVDHRDDAAVQELFDRMAEEGGRLDVLVNNVWGGYEGLHDGDFEIFEKPFWEQPAALWDAMFAAGARAHYVASAHAARLMVPAQRGLIVNISTFAGARYHQNVAYGVAKAATDRLTADMAVELRHQGVACVSLYPGLVRTEGIMKWAEYLDLANSESPEFVGRAVVALAGDPNVLERSGQVLVVAELAEDYGFTDVDGKRPHSIREQFEMV